jgi:hypothetical protein
MRFIPVLLAIILFIFPVFSGCVFLDSDDNGDKDKSPEGFEYEDLTSPVVINQDLVERDYTKPDVNDDAVKVSFKYETSWAFAYNTVYSYFGGVLQLWLTNLGDSEMYIYKFGIAPEWNDYNVTIPSNKLIKPNEEHELGLLHFGGPDYAGHYNYQLKFGLLARENESSDWYDWGLIGNKTYGLDVVPLKDGNSVVNYELDHNPKNLYDKVNNLIDPMDRNVRNSAVATAKKFEGPYNIFQVCEIFEYVKTNVSYVPDPKGNGNYWASAEETLELCAGDCEDQAVLFAGLISAISGTTRIYLTEVHAFAMAYIGNSESTLDLILSAIDLYYGTELKCTWLQDELGYWLVADTINALHLGGLPLGAEPLGSDNNAGKLMVGNRNWSWDFIDTNELIYIDVI